MKMRVKTVFTGLSHDEQKEADGGRGQNRNPRKRKILSPLVEDPRRLGPGHGTRRNQNGHDQQQPHDRHRHGESDDDRGIGPGARER
jgi:hypothetical protein